MLLDITNDDAKQGELALEPDGPRNQSKLMTAMDALNERYGRGSIHVGSATRQRVPSGWSMRQERLTPQYTTKFSDIPTAQA